MKRFIRTEQLATIRVGSLEEARTRLEAAVRAYEAASGAPVPKPAAVVATFPSHMIVADAAGGLHRYCFALGEAGPSVERREPYAGFETLNEEQMKGEAVLVACGRQGGKAALSDWVAQLVRREI